MTSIMQGMSEWQPVNLPGAQTFEIHSQHTGEIYRILVRAPLGPPPQAGYPALWMLDGDASFPLVFSKPAGGLFPAASTPADLGTGLTVAIGFPGGTPFDAPARSRNYTPQPDQETGDIVSGVFGGARDFLHFLVEELRPALSALYPLDPTRNTLFGFSYGGLFTVHTLLHCPGHFQRYWAASPSLWFSDALMMRRMREDASTRAAERLVITVGKDEQYATHALPAGRQDHLSRRAMVDNITEAAGLIARANPTMKVDLIVAADHDHFDMLLHGVRRAQAMAFTEAGSAD
ncbi:alpha/beta hydrolase [Agrobacterium sp. Ap1]|nr:alpha/beta hydrolase [Agrobacterium sp. Ap1]